MKVFIKTRHFTSFQSWKSEARKGASVIGGEQEAMARASCKRDYPYCLFTFAASWDGESGTITETADAKEETRRITVFSADGEAQADTEVPIYFQRHEVDALCRKNFGRRFASWQDVRTPCLNAGRI